MNEDGSPAHDDTPTRRSIPGDLPTTRGPVAGQRMFGRYKLESVAGRGGMGVVWRAKDEELGETVALKFLPEIVASDTVAVDELKEETRRARRLTHPHIVRIYDFERDDTAAAVSMEYVDGTTLAQFRLTQPGKVFSAEALAPLVMQLCAALGYAHQQAKVVHRDLKPANLLVTADGTLKVTDFGIARSLSETHTRLTGKLDGNSGTLLYMSPQQLTGGKPTPADDIYSIGATLYEMLCGKPPFYTGDITHQILNKIPPGLTEQRTALDHAGPPIPPQWEKTILLCLDKDAAKRPGEAMEIARQLGLAGDRPAVSEEKSRRELTPKAKPLSSLHYPSPGEKWDDLEPPAVSSIHYPNPDRKKKSGPAVWFDYLVILGLAGAGVVYLLGLTPLPRPWSEAPPAKTEPETAASPAGSPLRLPPEKEASLHPGRTGETAGITPSSSASKTANASIPTGSAPSQPTPAADSSREPTAPAGSSRTTATDTQPGPPAVTPTRVSAAVVRLTVIPENARVYRDESLVPVSLPLQLNEIPPGRHHLRLSAPGYQPKVVEFSVVAGQPVDLGTERLVAGIGSVLIDSQPSFAQFELQGDSGQHYRGVTPWDDGKLPIGEYTLTFTRPGNSDAVKKFVLDKDSKLRVMADFSGGSVHITIHGSALPQPKPATIAAPRITFSPPKTGHLTLEVSGPTEYQLLVDGRAIERSALGPEGVELPAAGELNLELKATGYQTATRKITLTLGGTESWKVSLVRNPPEEWNLAAPIGKIAPALPTPAAQPVPPVPPPEPVATPSAPPAARTRATTRGPARQMPRLLESVKPEYPTSVRASRIEGTVTVRVMILASGGVGEVDEVSSPDPKLTKSVKDALNKFRFTPAKIDGQPVDQRVTLDFEFRMDQ